MTTGAQTDPRKNFVPRLLPWLLVAVALVIYLLTLNHWVSLINLAAIAKTTGWNWQPQIYQPVTYAITYPFRWLTASLIPIALNLFSAVCAALTLGLLARSVALLPHDRTDAQRRREQSPFSIMTIRSAWLPPVFAVLVCGLQFTFWEYATNHTGEMFSLLMFAFVIWSLLEYRLDERTGRLFLAAFVYGAGMANDWAMVCYFPVFIAALIWIRRLSFFNLQFLGRMTLCGLAGLLFYLLLPLVAVVSKAPLTFWQTLHMNLSSGVSAAGALFTNGDARKTLGVMSLSSLLPVLMLAIRWHSSFGDTSRIGRSLATLLFHFVHAVFLIICVWVAFDPPFSPREKGFGLTLYYLSALGVGYYSGYFLLVFRRELNSRFQMRGVPKSNYLNFLAVTVVVLLFLTAGVGLIYKNAPLIRAANGKTFEQYASLTAECLPRTGGILLSDDPRRLYLTEAALTRDDRAKNFVFLDTQSLIWPAYHKILHQEYPNRFPDTITAAETNQVTVQHLLALLRTLAKTNDLYYLHPSFGYYFEEFYLKPHGLVYQLKTLPTKTLMPPLPDKDEIAENEAFWARAELKAFPPIKRAFSPPKPVESESWGEQMLKLLHASQERNLNAIVAGSFYSRSLDYWGVELQRAGELGLAAENFEMAQKLNPDNAVAQINLQFNQSLQKGKHVPLDLAKTTLTQFGPYDSWSKLLDADGPFDEPSFCFANGLVWVRNLFFRQALALFTRVCQLEPNSLPAHLWLAQLCDFNRLPDQTLKVVHAIRSQPAKFTLDRTNEMQLAVIGATAYFQKNDLGNGARLLDAEVSRNPTNDAFLTTVVQFFIAKGLYTNALTVIDSRLKELPDDPHWLLNQGLADVQLKEFDKAIPVLTRVLSMETTNNAARFYRAIAYLGSGQIDKARADYENLAQTSDAFLATAAQFFITKGLYTNALAIVDSRLKDVPDDPQWLLNKGLVYARLEEFGKAIPILTQVLSLQTNNSAARFDRALAYLGSGKLDKAHADYEELNQIFTNSFRIEYGLGEIAWRQHRTNDAIKYYNLYLTHANTNTTEASNIVQRLHLLEKPSP